MVVPSLWTQSTRDHSLLVICHVRVWSQIQQDLFYYLVLQYQEPLPVPATNGILIRQFYRALHVRQLIVSQLWTLGTLHEKWSLGLHGERSDSCLWSSTRVILPWSTMPQTHIRQFVIINWFIVRLIRWNVIRELIWDRPRLLRLYQSNHDSVLASLGLFSAIRIISHKFTC